MLFTFVFGGQTDLSYALATKNDAKLQHILDICKKKCKFAQILLIFL